jgi:AraC family transcriptional regulator
VLTLRGGRKGMSEALRITNGAFGRVALLDMDRSLVRHAHPHCHVLLKVEGDDTQFTVDGRTAPLTDDVAVLVNAWETHAYEHDPRRRNALILALYIEPQWLCSFRANWMASGAPGFFEQPVGHVTPKIRRIADDLAAEMVHHPNPSNHQEELLSALMIAVIEQFTQWRTIGPSLRDVARIWTPDRRIRRAIELMRTNTAAHPSIDAIATAAGLSRAHFFRLFEQSTGVTPHVFLNVLKIERAVQVVASSNESLAAISAGLGFGSPAHFSRFFRDHVSVAPGEFRSVVRMRA